MLKSAYLGQNSQGTYEGQAIFLVSGRIPPFPSTRRNPGVRTCSINKKEVLMGDWKELNQGVNYSQNFHGKHAFPNLTYSITFQFMFHKYLIELQNVSPWCVIDVLIYLNKKSFFLKISRFLCFCKIHRSQNLWCRHRGIAR